MSDTVPAASRLRVFLLGCLMVLGVTIGVYGSALGFLIGLSFLTGLGSDSGPWFEYEPSPDGRYEVVRESRSSFLDGYTKLWLTTRGERDRANWLLIAPEVDGTWFTEWLGPTHLLLTDHGAWPEKRQPRRVVHWRDVRVETRPRPTCTTVDAPDELYRCDIWTSEDSRGRRSTAWLASNWQNPESVHCVLLDEGHWRLEAKWLGDRQLELAVFPDEGVVMPAIRERFGDIVIRVRR